MLDLLALTNELRERVKTGNAETKKELLFFLAALILGSNGLWNGAFFKRLEQPRGTKQTKGMRPLNCPNKFIFQLIIIRQK